MLSLVISVQTPGHTRHSGESRAQARLPAGCATSTMQHSRPPVPSLSPVDVIPLSRRVSLSLKSVLFFYHTSHMHHAAGVPFRVQRRSP